VIAVTAGVAGPLTIIAAGIAVAFLATTAAEFTRAEPAAGRFITYVETGLGPRADVVTALLLTVGYTCPCAGRTGGWFEFPGAECLIRKEKAVS
jgi:amino acid transporter